MSSPTETQTPLQLPEILTVKQVANWLQFTVRQVYELTRRRGQGLDHPPIPVLRINGNLRFRRADVAVWLDGLAVESAA
jgi:hypothetical protein